LRRRCQALPSSIRSALAEKPPQLHASRLPHSTTPPALSWRDHWDVSVRHRTNAGLFSLRPILLPIAGSRNAEETLNQRMRTIDGCELYGAA
jgi:hypothetical protein